MTTKKSKPMSEQLSQETVQLILSSYVSVNLARMRTDAFCAAYSAHTQQGALPEEARSLAQAAVASLSSLVQARK